MANIKISQLPAKGANLAAEDLLEVSEFTGTGYVSKSITGQEIIDAASGGGATWGGITGTLSSQTDLQTALNNKQDAITLTTTGTSGAATLVGSTLNIPQYSGGGGLQGPHALVTLASNDITSPIIRSISSGSASTFVGNRLYAYPFIPNQSFTSLNLFVTVSGAQAGSLCRIAIYADSNGYPSSRLYLSSDLDLSTTGQKTALTTFNFVAGTTYWLVFHGNSIVTNATVNNFAINDLLPIKMTSVTAASNYIQATSAFTTSTPNPFPSSGTYTTANIPAILITKA